MAILDELERLSDVESLRRSIVDTQVEFETLVRDRMKEIDQAEESLKENMVYCEKQKQILQAEHIKIQEKKIAHKDKKISEERQILNAQRAVDMVKTEIDRMLPDHERLLLQKNNDEEIVQSLRNQIAAREQLRNYRIEKLQSAIRTYETCLGLTLHMHRDNKVTCTFTSIDPSNIDRKFVITVQIDGNDLYSVKECNPIIEITTLVNTLNLTDDFCSFIREIRKRFRSTVM